MLATRAGGRIGGGALALGAAGSRAALGPLWDAARRDPGAALRRAVPLALAALIVHGATGQSGRHPAPWFGTADDAGAVEASVGGTGSAAPPAAPSPRAARADPVVFGLQAELADRGYYAGAIDGIVGSRTREAIRAWEGDRGLPPTGVADETLLARIRAGASDLPRAASAPTTLDPTAPDPVATGGIDAPAPARADDVADGADPAVLVQRGLVAWGAEISVDGLIGPQTLRAVRDYRGANGLPAADADDPAADATLVEHMRAAGLLP